MLRRPHRPAVLIEGAAASDDDTPCPLLPSLDAPRLDCVISTAVAAAAAAVVVTCCFYFFRFSSSFSFVFFFFLSRRVRKRRTYAVWPSTTSWTCRAG